MLQYVLLFATLSFTFSEKEPYDLEAYNSALQLAESYLIDEQFCNAAEVYQTMSSDFDLWGDDRLNALLCALECGDEKRIDYFVQSLLDRGATEDFFKVVLSEYNYFKKDNRVSKFNLDSRELRSNDLVSSFIKINFADFQEKGRTLKEVNAHNYTLLMELIENGNFPTEEYFSFSTYRSEEGINTFEFNHILQRLVEEKPSEFGKLLPNWYRDGFLSKRLFVYLMAWAEPEEKYRMNCINGTQYFLRWNEQIYTCAPKHLIVINQNRARLHLEPLHQYLKKSLYREKTDVPFALGENITTTQTPIDPKYDIGFMDLIQEGELAEIR